MPQRLKEEQCVVNVASKHSLALLQLTEAILATTTPSSTTARMSLPRPKKTETRPMLTSTLGSGYVGVFLLAVVMRNMHMDI
jgi:hypothetical protein